MLWRGGVRRGGLSGLLLSVAFAARLSFAAADPPKLPVRVESVACAATPQHEVLAILRVELGAQLVEGDPSAEAYRVAVACGGDVVTVTVTKPDGAARSSFTNLAGAPPTVRSRIVALAIAERVRDLDREAPPPPPEPPPLPPPKVEPPAALPPEATAPDRAAPAASAPRPVQIGAFAAASTFQLDGRWLLGGGARVDYATGRFCAGLDAALATTTERFDLGGARVLFGYGAPYVAWREPMGRVETRLGAGAAFGAASIRGESDDPLAIAGTVRGAWAAPYGLAAAGIAVTGALRIDARAQVGWVVLPVIGEVARGGDIELKGLWASLQLGAALAL
jgi:hypothetical protein